MDDLLMNAAVCLLVGFAGFVDSIAGGGGMISLPAYFMTGMPAHLAYGTNKFSASCGATFTMAVYWKNGAVDLLVGILAAAGAFAGAAAGSSVAIMLSDRTLSMMLVVLLPVIAVFMIVKKVGDDEDRSGTLTKTKKALMGLAIGLLVGGYDGIFGPGTGTIAALAFTAIMRYDLRTATGNAKVLNLASNYASALTFMMSGLVDYKLGLAAGACDIIGSLIGSNLAVKKGARFIRPIMLCVMTALILKVLYGLIFG